MFCFRFLRQAAHPTQQSVRIHEKSETPVTTATTQIQTTQDFDCILIDLNSNWVKLHFVSTWSMSPLIQCEFLQLLKLSVDSRAFSLADAKFKLRTRTKCRNRKQHQSHVFAASRYVSIYPSRQQVTNRYLHHENGEHIGGSRVINAERAERITCKRAEGTIAIVIKAEIFWVWNCVVCQRTACDSDNNWKCVCNMAAIWAVRYSTGGENRGMGCCSTQLVSKFIR